MNKHLTVDQLVNRSSSSSPVATCDGCWVVINVKKHAVTQFKRTAK